MRNNMQKLLRQVVAEWKDYKLPDIVDRDVKVSLEGGSIVSVVGVRRAGKTYLLLNTIKNLQSEAGRNNILYVDFEDIKLTGMKADMLNELLVAFREMFAPAEDKKIYLFFDEIQNIDGWEKWLRGLHNRKKYKIIISGSSAALLSREIATALRGRSINYEIYPFNFKEFLRAKGYEYDLDIVKHTEKRGEIQRFLNEYIQYGGFPEVVLSSEEVKKKLLISYFEAIFHRDIVERNKIRNINLMEQFLLYLLNNNATYISLGKIENFFSTMGMKVSKKTLGEYLKYARDVFFMFTVEIFSYKIKDRLQYPRKVYLIDTGLVNALVPSISSNIGRLYENVVFLHLKRMIGNNPGMGIYYWKDRQGREVDFVITDELKPRKLIQVSYDVSSPATMKREKRSLLKAMEEFNLKKGIIITGHYSGEEEEEGKYIRFIPLYEWLLADIQDMQI
jgi:hypothetical protein